MSKLEKIDKLVSLEWADFQKVNNEGGRAACQDDHETFFIMRKSYFEPLREDVIDCILDDFDEAHAKGRNLVLEKYGRMMKSTAPLEFEKISSSLPEPSVITKTYAELIVVFEVEWMEEFANKFPKLSSHGRPVHSYDDTDQQTSFETYLRGELFTYSENTLRTYYDFIKSSKLNNENIIFKTMQYEVSAYGYRDLTDAEAKLN